MKTITTHAISIAHDDGGGAVALVMTPGSLGVEVTELTSQLSYQLHLNEKCIILQDSTSLRSNIKLADVPLGLLQCCERGLPMFVLNDAGNETLQVIRPARPVDAGVSHDQ